MRNLKLPTPGSVCNLATECCNFTHTKNLKLGIVWACIYLCIVHLRILSIPSCAVEL